MKTRTLIAFAALATAVQTPLQAAGPDPVARGRYLVQTSGCNDCHTPGYMPTEGEVPEALWLTGSELGFAGPWGVSYASNLRLLAGGMDAAQWRKHARTPRRPPMPWFNLAAMTDADLDAIYSYLRKLGPTGAPAPAALAPGQPIPTAHIVFMPQAPTGVTEVSASAK